VIGARAPVVVVVVEGSESDFLASCAVTLQLKAVKENAHLGHINTVAFSPDGKTIASGSDDQTLKVWNAGAFVFSLFFVLDLTRCPSAQPRCSYRPRK